MNTELSVLVSPLTPPFEGRVYVFRFEAGGKELAVSRKDFLRVQKLLGHPQLVGRRIVLSPAGDRIRIEACAV